MDTYMYNRKSTDILRFEDTCRLLRKYIEEQRPQSFASVWGLFKKLYNNVRLYGYKAEVTDLFCYAEIQQIERFGF